MRNEILNQWKGANVTKRQKILKMFNYQIVFLQHERQIHLLVMLFFAGTSLFLGCLSLIVNNIFILLVFFIIIVVTCFYIWHYYVLENTCQSWQKLFLKLEKELLINKKVKKKSLK